MDNEVKNEITAKTPRDIMDKAFIETDDAEEQSKITGIYNAYLEKADMLRRVKSSDVLDRIFNQLEERVDKKAGEFTNKELLDTVQLLNTVVEKGITISKEESPKIQINQQNQININSPQMNRESRDRVAEAIKAIMKKASEQPQGSIIDVPSEEVIQVENDSIQESEN